MENSPKPALIAEIGLNHIGDEPRAGRLLRQALDAGVDGVTFQIREPKFYQAAEMSGLRLSNDFYRQAAVDSAAARCRFGIAICDDTMIAPLAAAGVDFWKTLSWDFRNDALRAKLNATGKPVYVSTGLSTSEDVREGSKGLRDAILVHTQLSHTLADVNLKAITTMRADTGLPVAFGLHCANHDVLKVALAYEPQALLFYIKERGVKSFDDEHAIFADELASAIQALRNLAPAIGSGIKGEMKRPDWTKESK